MLQIYGAASNFKIHPNSGITAKQTKKGISGFYLVDVNNKGFSAAKSFRPIRKTTQLCHYQYQFYVAYTSESLAQTRQIYEREGFSLKFYLEHNGRDVR
jgi:hypothetical protein